MKIQDIPKEDRPRERLLKYGEKTLSNAELMAIILRTGTKNENAVDMSNRLIKENGLNNLFDCSLKELQKIKGIGPNKAMQILAMSELGRRYNKSKNLITKIGKAEDVYKFFKDDLENEKQENFYLLILNNKNHIIKSEFITRGVLDASIIHPREIFRPAIKNSASKIVLIHNHPSGNPEPSEEDLDITRKIIKLGKEMDIRVLDHIIIGKENSENKKAFWSWVENG